MIDLRETLRNWLPYRLLDTSGGLQCEWLYAGEKPFTEPFFIETITALKASLSQRRCKVVSSLDMLEEWAYIPDTVRPAAIIFHVSRCGSTLLSQLLSCDPANIVLSEVPVFDELLRLPFKYPSLDEKEVTDLLKGAILFYSQVRRSGQEHLFIKTDSWHLHFYEQYRQLFPDTPFILLYRHPLEVLHSQKKQRGLQSVPGLIEPEVLGLKKPKDTFDLDSYMADVLENYFKKMLWMMKNDSLCISYNYIQGIPELFKKIYELLSCQITTRMEQQIIKRSRYHGKHPVQIFEEVMPEFPVPENLNGAYNYYQELDVLTAGLVRSGRI